MVRKPVRLDEAKNDSNIALKIETLLCELYADQYGLKLESITVKDGTEEESA